MFFHDLFHKAFPRCFFHRMEVSQSCKEVFLGVTTDPDRSRKHLSLRIYAEACSLSFESPSPRSRKRPRLRSFGEACLWVRGWEGPAGPGRRGRLPLRFHGRRGRLPLRYARSRWSEVWVWKITFLFLLALSSTPENGDPHFYVYK